MFSTLLQLLLLVAVSTAKVCRSDGAQTLLLNDGNRMPTFSFGTVGKTDIMDVVIKPAIVQAIKSGYRQIDTANIYRNEGPVGQGIAEAISQGLVTREELWVTTKLHPSVGTREGVIPKLRESLKNLQLDYVDLYLIHVPDNVMNVPDHDIVNIWRGMEDAKNMNLTRSIGVSNFNSTHINRLLENSLSKPAVNEIEINPTYTNTDIITYCHNQDIAILAYAPFGFMVPRPFVSNPPTSTFEEPILKQLAQKYGKIPSQIVIRYLIDRGTVPIPRSTNTEHINTNIDVFDFSLTAEEINSINALNIDFKVYSFEPAPLTQMLNYYDIY